jgi:Winged helix DNA-binding domain
VPTGPGADPASPPRAPRPVRADGDVLGRRALNRALLARQHLLARTDASVLAVTAHLVGLQAQAPWAPYTGLWTRIAGLRHADLADRLLDRDVVRIAAMRGTVHLLVADDALVLPTLTEPIVRGTLRAAQPYGRDLRDVDLDDLAAAARDIVEAQPTGTVTLGQQLAARWPDVDPKSLAYAARCTLPLVQVPPRAVWGRSGATTWTTTRAWLGREPVDLSDPDAHAAAVDAMVLRYLAAFGPASAADVQTWSGLTRLGPVLERLRPRLVTVRAEPAPGARRERELFDLPDAPRPDPDTPAPVRLLAQFDNLLLSHADRSRFVDDEARRRMWRANGAVPGAVLVDGEVAGHWTVTRTPRAATLTVTPFHPLPAAARAEVEAEGQRLVEWVADDAADHAVVWHGDDGDRRDRA